MISAVPSPLKAEDGLIVVHHIRSLLTVTVHDPGVLCMPLKHNSVYALEEHRTANEALLRFICSSSAMTICSLRTSLSACLAFCQFPFEFESLELPSWLHPGCSSLQRVLPPYQAYPPCAQGWM